MPTDPPALSRRTRNSPWLLAAIAVALTLQGIVVWRSEIIAKDGIGFLRVARSLNDDPLGAARREQQHPGYPFLIAAAARIAIGLGAETGEAWLIGARIVGNLAGAGCVLFTWLLARRIFDAKTADLAAWFAATLPLFRWNAADVLSDSPHLMLYLAAAWLVCEGFARGAARWFALAGIVSGLAYLVRPEGLMAGFVAAVVLTGCLLNAGWRRARGVAQINAAPAAVPGNAAFLFRALVAVSLGLVFVAAPYVVVVRALTLKKDPFAAPPQPEAIVAAAGGPTAGLTTEPVDGRNLAGETKRPASWFGRIGAALVEFSHEFAQGMHYFLLLPLAVAVFAPGCPRPALRPMLYTTLLLFAHLSLLIVLFATAGYISHRHVMPSLAIVLPGAASGVLYAGDRLAALLPRVASPVTWRRGVAIAFIAWQTPLAVRPLHREYAPWVAAARYVRDHSQPDEGVLASSPYVRFYAERPGVLLGPEAPNLVQGLASAPGGRAWPFIALEVDTREFDPAVLDASGVRYRQVLELPMHRKRPWSKLLVFEAESEAERANSDRLANRPAP